MQRRRMHPRQPILVGGIELADLQLHRLQQPGGGLASRGGQRDPKWRLPVQGRQQSRHRRGLTGTWSTGQHRKPLRERDFRRGMLLFAAGREQPSMGGRFVRFGRGHVPARHRRLAVPQPVPVEVQQVPARPQHRRRACKRAGPNGGQPSLGSGHGNPSTPTCCATDRRSTHTDRSAVPAPRTRPPARRSRRFRCPAR